MFQSHLDGVHPVLECVPVAGRVVTILNPVSHLRQPLGGSIKRSVVLTVVTRVLTQLRHQVL